MELYTLLGGNGTIGRELAPVLQHHQIPFRLVSRNPASIYGGETFAADLLNREKVFEAVKGSSVVFLLAGKRYRYKVWKKDWPLVMRHTIDACKAAGAKLVFFDNVYMYGKVDGLMTEETPLHPSSRKGQVRAEIARMLMDEINSGGLKAMIARSADFYGPGTKVNSVTGQLVFERMKKKNKAQCLCDGGLPHSYTYTPDAARALFHLAGRDSAYGQVWHLPTATPAPTAKEFVEKVSRYMQAPPGVQVLPTWMIRLIGLFVSEMGEFGEMLYQYQYPYHFDSSKFEKAFDFRPTSYEEGIKSTAAWFMKN